ncbi:L,D-transpeptidase family protein [Streptomyces sp. NPDC050560]|uniref:L,D-transpeptidase family protein n=1 Tax=Streptomyces sp. NPDC050560 TaxID=3365630 RepID=UPI0037B1149B
MPSPQPPRTPYRRAGRYVLCAAVLGALTACGAGTDGTHPAAGKAASPAGAPERQPRETVQARRLPAQVPGLGPKTLAEVPDDTRQVVVASGAGKDSSTSRVTVYRRSADGWEAGPTWSARNAERGWSDDHHAGDLRSPVGVYGLTDAGGALRDPGSRLPYDRSTGGFHVVGTGFDGESLAGSFDYVVAINYNREPGTSPLDWTRPLGDGKGGGIWFHVTHGGPTHGCVSLSKAHMRELLRTLDPAAHPVVAMGPARALAR